VSSEEKKQIALVVRACITTKYGHKAQKGRLYEKSPKTPKNGL
jgi:hypothetical protein